MPENITLNMEALFDEKLSALKSFYCREDFESVLDDYDFAVKNGFKGAASSCRARLGRLCAARNSDAGELIRDRSMLEEIPTRTQMEENLLDAFYDIYKKAPKTTDFMERLVRRLAPEYAADSVRTAILKKFVFGAQEGSPNIKTEKVYEWAKARLDSNEKKGFSSLNENEKKILIISKIDDSIFSDEDAACELTGMCKDLAAGNFRPNGKTRRYLYYFAFMFGMSVPLAGRPYDEKTDIVKNLFQDYYNDNLLRFLSGDYTDPKESSALESEPSGEGINYKNFAEAVYIYFLCHDELDLTPGQKTDMAEEVIGRCVNLAKKREKEGNGKSIKRASYTYTEIYRNDHMNVLLSKKIDEIPEYITDNFIVIPSSYKGKDRIMAASGENTVSGLIDDIIADLDDESVSFTPPAFYELLRSKNSARDEYTEGAAAQDKKEAEKKLKEDWKFTAGSAFEWKTGRLLREKFSDDKNFIKIVDRLDKKVNAETGRFRKAERARMLVLLRVLAVNSSEEAPLRWDDVPQYMEAGHIVSADRQLDDARKTLKALGFDVCTVSLKKQRPGKADKKEKYCYLGNRKYGDAAMDELLLRIRAPYYTPDEASDRIISELLIRRARADKKMMRITRSELIAIHFNLYIELVDETEDFATFPEVYEDYAASVNPYLEEARYQPISEKNLFDMYVVTTLYLYMAENSALAV